MTEVIVNGPDDVYVEREGDPGAPAGWQDPYARAR
jgi:hypothetical protein